MNADTFKKEVLPIKDKLYRMALRMLNETAEAQDAVQEVLLKLWDQRRQLSGIRNLEAWAIRVTKNHCLDRLRSRQRRTAQLEQVKAAENHQVMEEQSLEQKELLKQIRSLMNRLPEKQKLVMHLRDIEGLSYKEIMEALDMPENQVKTNLFRARKKMRVYLLKTVSYE